MLVPLVWPWVHAYRFRLGHQRFFWAFLCLLLGVAWIGLGVLGSRLPDETTVEWTRALGGYYFAFFLVIPFVLGRFVGVPVGGLANARNGT
jgi:quinol-cytochrome oxidoreductase complex cytochrome b subunit